MTLTKDQREERRQGIGGSDAGAILGIHPQMTPLDVYYSKVEPQENNDSSEFLRIRSDMEQVVVDAYVRATKRRVMNRRYATTSKEHPHMRANVDRLVINESRVLECKTQDFHRDTWGAPGTDEVPPHIVAQATHYLEVTKRKVCDVAVLFLAYTEFAVYHVEYDAKVAAQLVEAEYEFWHHNVLAAVPPDPVNLADVRRRWATVTDHDPVQASMEVEAACKRLAEIKARGKDLDVMARELEMIIKTNMQGHDTLLGQDGATLATWKESTVNRKASEARTYTQRRFLVK